MQLHHLCIQTNCYAASLAFYRDALGMTIEKETANFHDRAFNTWLSGNGLFLELQTPKTGASFSPCDAEAAGIQHMCFHTDDLDGFYARVKTLPYVRFREKNGAAIYCVKGGRLLKLVAPEGTIIECRDTPGC